MIAKYRLKEYSMRKTTLSLAAFTCLAIGVHAEDTISDAFEKSKFTGQFRTFYIDRTYDGTVNNNRNSLAVGGHLGFETGEFNGLSFGARMYNTNLVDIHDDVVKTSSGVYNYDPSLFGGDFDSYTYLGELYLNYKISNTNIKAGRQKLDTPMAGSDDARMLPNLFEAVVITNNDIKDTTLIAAHVTKEAVGTFGNVYPANDLGMISGYGYGYKNATSGKFRDMGVVAVGAPGADTSGVSIAAAIYSGVPNLKLQAWDYYAYDILNVLYLQADYGWDCKFASGVKMNAAAQYINERDIGDSLGGEIDSNFWAMKIGANYGNLNGFIAYSKTGSSNGTLNGGILSPWGGMPAFTQAMVTRHQFFPDTNSWKVNIGYNLKDLGLPVTASTYYTAFDIGAENTYVAGTAYDASEAGFDIAYKPTKDLELKLRANFPRDFAPNQDMSEYRIIANYNF
jgi:hypothetical protein